jgi:hypothetical protein
MTEPEREATASEAGKRTIPRWVWLLAAGLAILLTFVFQSWLAGRRLEATRRQEIARGVQATASTLTFLVLDRNSQRKLRDAADGIARAGDYSVVTIADAKGNVLASTDRRLATTQLLDLKNAPLEARVENERGRTIATCAIALGGTNSIGALRVELIRP